LFYFSASNGYNAIFDLNVFTPDDMVNK